MIDQRSSIYSNNDEDALCALYQAATAGDVPHTYVHVAQRLIERGHRAHVAVRVAFARSVIVFRPDCPVIGEELPRPGLEIAKSIERNTPIVAKALCYGTLAGRWLREGVWP